MMCCAWVGGLMLFPNCDRSDLFNFLVGIVFSLVFAFALLGGCRVWGLHHPSPWECSGGGVPWGTSSLCS